MPDIREGTEKYIICEFTRKINGQLQREVVMLFYPMNLNIGHALHQIGLDYCINQCGGSSPLGGLKFWQLMINVTPEMLKPYGITMLWPNRIAVSTDNDPPIVSPYEAEMYEEMREKFCFDRDNYAKNMSETSEQLAEYLEFQKAQGHPDISTWSSKIISSKAIEWASQYVDGDETDLSRFFEKKLQEAKPHSDNKDQSFTNTASSEPEGQRTEHIPQ